MPSNSQKNPKRQNRARRSQLSRQLFLRYIFAFTAFAVGFVALVLFARLVCSQFTWMYGDPFYTLLNMLDTYIIVWVGGVLLIGWLIITYRFFQKTPALSGRGRARLRTAGRSRQCPHRVAGCLEKRAR